MEVEPVVPHVRILDDLVVNQIAAGEVVERPASVVKELVENAIDAGSSHITVAISNGGRTSVEVLDNGHGMSRQDALLAIERFGTSKITSADDLESIRTLGFRGEALPSIASVSKFALETRSVVSPTEGTQITIHGGVLKDVSDKHMPSGTRIRVQNLFFNVPARKKFLRSETTETGFVKALLADFALAYPRVRFTLVVDGKEALNYPEAADFAARVQQVGVAGPHALQIDRSRTTETGTIEVTGSLCRPIDAVSTGLRLRLLVNGRSVRDSMLLRAVREGYGSYLKPGKYPKGVLAIALPCSDVDVNVHPQKTEVRFRNPSEIFRAIVQAVHEALISTQPELELLGAERAGSAHPYSNEQPQSPLPRQLSAGFGFAGKSATHFTRPTVTFSGSGILADQTTQEDETGFELAARAPFAPQFTQQGRFAGPTRVTSAAEQQRGYDPERAFAEESTVSPSVGSPSVGPPSVGSRIGVDYNSFRFVGQIFELYLLFEGSGRFYLIDMHAAHERVTYFRLRKQFHDGTIRSQLLLVPETLPMEPDRLERFVNSFETLQKLGIDCELFGEDSLIVRALPAVLGATSAAALFADLLSLPEWQSWDTLLNERVEEVLARMSCHGSVRSGRILNREEVHALIESLAEAESSAFCPHGRPTAVSFSKLELEQLFGRT